MLDRDLAYLYEIETKVFKQSVNRNIERFPQDFMFELTKAELENWRSQIVTSNSDKMGLRRTPYTFVSDLIRDAKSSIILIDNYVDDSVLTLFSKNQNIDVTIYTKTISKQLTLDLKKYNAQYKTINIKKFQDSHDRFMIIDNIKIYHIGASLKDLGKQWFAFSKFDVDSFGLLEKLENVK